MTTKPSHILSLVLAITLACRPVDAQHAHANDTSATATPPEVSDAEVVAADLVMGAMSASDMKAMAAHIEMTPQRAPNRADSTRAAELVKQLRGAISKYRDVKVAEAEGFKQFAPQIKNQRVYHFTNYRSALGNEFNFEPTRPTSLLYTKDKNGKFVLTGAMYTAPKRFNADDLDKRVPLSIARWHKHVNWCFPRWRESDRWTEKRNGRPVFGPLGVSTRNECQAAGGRFQEEVFGWMVHANVFAGDDPKIIWGDEHQMTGHEMSEHRH
ncbi:MAG TPA: hypothetical protein VM939_13260 [Gemmatimonadaceae bacterium]|nr:hypothetical protein [Gemmatimonadaceae bacterium]